MKNMKLIMENFNKFLKEEEEKGEKGKTSNSPQADKFKFNPKVEMEYTTKDGKTLLVRAGPPDDEVVFGNKNIMAGQEAGDALKSKENMHSFLTKIEGALGGKIVDAEFKDMLQKMLQKISEDDRKAFLSALNELLDSGLLVTAELLMDLNKTNPEELGKTLYRMVPKGEDAPSYDFRVSSGGVDMDMTGAAMLEDALEKLPKDERVKILDKISNTDRLESEFQVALEKYAKKIGDDRFS